MQQTGTAGSYDLSSDYRYGYNGKEKDDEIKGETNSLDYGARIYDPRVGKFLSVDPLFKSFQWISTYVCAENDVISCLDLSDVEKYRNTKNLKGGQKEAMIDARFNNIPVKDFQPDENELFFLSYLKAERGRGALKRRTGQFVLFKDNEKYNFDFIDDKKRKGEIEDLTKKGNTKGNEKK